MMVLPFSNQSFAILFLIDNSCKKPGPPMCPAVRVSSSSDMVCRPCSKSYPVWCESSSDIPSIAGTLFSSNNLDQTCSIDWVRKGRNEFLVVMTKMTHRDATLHCVVAHGGAGLLSDINMDTGFLTLPQQSSGFWISIPVQRNANYSYTLNNIGVVTQEHNTYLKASICQRQYNPVLHPTSTTTSTTTTPIPTTTSTTTTPTTTSTTTKPTTTSTTTKPTTTSTTTKPTTTSTTTKPTTTSTTTKPTTTSTTTKPTTTSTTTKQTTTSTTTKPTTTSTTTTPTTTSTTTKPTTTSTTTKPTTTSTTTKPTTTSTTTKQTTTSTTTKPTTTSTTTKPITTSTTTKPTTTSTTTKPTTTSTTTKPTTTSTHKKPTTTSTTTKPTTTSTTTKPTSTLTTIKTTTTSTTKKATTLTATTSTTTRTTQSTPTTASISTTTTSTSTKAVKTQSTATTSPITSRYTTETTNSTEDIEWIKVKFCEYFINQDNLTFSESVRYCKEELNATLLFFNHIGLYFRYMKENKLNISSGTFWVAGNSDPNSTDCFNMDVENYDAVLHDLGINCGVLRGSICARAIRYNSTEDLYNEVTNDPDFIRMIEGMTVKKNSTQRSLRKKISIRDHTAVQAGTGVSIAMMVSSFAFVMMCDMPRIKNFFRKREKKGKKVKDKRRSRKQSEA